MESKVLVNVGEQRFDRLREEKKLYIDIHLLNVIFLIVEVIVFISLTIEVFGDMNSDVLTISAIVFGVGMVGNCICAIIRAIQGMKKE